MNMVATSRLRHAKEAATANRPYAQKVSEVVHAVAKNAGMDFSHPLLEKHEDGKKLVFLITSDKGLAGAYSSNACKAAEALIEKENDTDFVIVGRKGVGHFKSRGHNVIKEFIGISEHPSSEDARDIALELIRLYKTGVGRGWNATQFLDHLDHDTSWHPTATDLVVVNLGVNDRQFNVSEFEPCLSSFQIGRAHV